MVVSILSHGPISWSWGYPHELGHLQMDSITLGVNIQKTIENCHLWLIYPFKNM